MSLIICEGLDRTGKSSVAQSYKDQGYEIVHMSAPAKGTTPDAFLQEMMDLVAEAATRDIFLDRSYYGEACIWPNVYNRPSLLDEESLEILRELEESVGTTRILMHDPNTEAHWKRCVDNNEPLTKPQFIKARTLYSTMADKYDFQRKTIDSFPEAKALAHQATMETKSTTTSTVVSAASADQTSQTAREVDNRTPQQIKLDKANAINEVLSKRLIKGKGPIFDELERSIRGFLNTELGKIFGNNAAQTQSFSKEEVELLKFFCERLKEKEN